MKSQAVASPRVATITRGAFRLDTDVCEALRLEAFTALKSLPKRGAEIGGLLTRRVGLAADGFHPIPCQHLYGPSYRLSPPDFEVFRSQYRELKANPSLAVVGYFRSSTRPDFQPDSEDLQIVREIFSDTAAIVLIQPSRAGHAIFRVYHPESGCDPAQCDEFEVRNQLLSPVPVPVPVPAAVPAIVEPMQPQPASPTAAIAPAVPSPASPSPWKRIAGVAAFASVVVASGAFYFVSRDSRPAAHAAVRAPAPPDLTLQVVSQPGGLRLSWNRDLPAIRQATGGTLRIHDGDSDREITLDPAQVAQAVVFYTPATQDVTFQLKIQGQGNTPVTAMARILGGAKIPDRPTPAAPVLPAKALRRESPSRPETEPDPVFPAPAEQQSRPAPSAVRSIASSIPAPDTPTAQKPSEPVVRESAPVKTVEAAQLRPQSSPSPSILMRVEPSPPSAPQRTAPQRIDPPRTATAPPVATARPEEPAEAPVQARPLRQYLPSRNSPGAPVVLTPMTVIVEVKIDEQGRVTDAHALHPASQFWGSKASEAAKLWRFQPATLHGKPVPSVSTINFRFAPQR